MKKIKIMLLSLALFAVVGGALALTAKFHATFCTTNAYWGGSGNPVYYCAFAQGSNILTTSCAASPVVRSTTTTIGTQKVCTTVLDANGGCSDLFGGAISCPVTTSYKTN